MPPTWPRSQLLGSGFGHRASTSNRGMAVSPLCAGAVSGIARTATSAPAVSKTWAMRIIVSSLFSGIRLSSI
jgi:hypothetical protein